MNFNQKYLFSGYGFSESRGPYLVLDEIIGQAKRNFFYIRDSKFTIEKNDEKYCIGSYDLRKDHFNPCPTRSKIDDPKYTLCDECKRRQGFNPAFYNASFISSKQRERNKKNHSVYLANFGIGCNKVGIAHTPRLKRRLLEQGARSAMLVKNCNNAYEAREIEEYTHKHLGIPETVTRNKKIDFISKKYDYINARNRLMRIRDKISQEFSLARKGKILQLNSYYLGNENIENPILVKNKYISGRGVGIVGSVYVCEESNRQFMIDLHSFIAHIVRTDLRVIKNKYKKTVKQNSLF